MGKTRDKKGVSKWGEIATKGERDSPWSSLTVILSAGVDPKRRLNIVRERDEREAKRKKRKRRTFAGKIQRGKQREQL